MSGSERKRISKWDLQDGPKQRPSSLDDIQKNARKLVQNRESQPEFAAAGSNNDQKWYVGAEANNEHGGEVLDASMPWDADIKMSPGLDDLKQRKSNRSPKSGSGRSNRRRSRSQSRSRSRSRSRSPRIDFNRDSKSNDRSSVRPQPCKEFSGGRCRRGDHCPYLHHYDKNPEDQRYSGGGPQRDEASRYGVSDDSWENPSRIWISNNNNNNLCNNFLKGRCFRGESCRYSHHSAVSEDGIGKGSSDESLKARENVGRNRMNNEPGRGGDIPCKFFAAGNCRNGKFCRFSHNQRTSDSPDDVSRDDWRRRGHSLSNVDQVREANLNLDYRSWVHPMENDRAEGRSESEYHHHPLREENAGGRMEVSESKVAENWDGDRDINVEAVLPLISQHSSVQKNPSLDDKKETRYNAMSGGIDLNFSSASVPPRQSLENHHQSSSALFGLNAVGQNQQAFAAPLYAPTEEFNTNNKSRQQPLPLPDGNNRSFNTAPGVGDTKRSKEVTSEIPNSKSTVSREQLSQLTNLSVSLAQLFGSGQQLPLLYAALNGSNSVSAAAAPNQAQKQYDPVTDSVDLNKPDTTSEPSPAGFAPKSVDQKSEIPSQTLVSSVELKIESHQPNKPTTEPVTEEVETAANENKKGKDGGGPAEKLDGDGNSAARADEGKNGKVIRAFKFALVEFVKELLKPTWKEGQLSKEDHKTIVKKVVDKVSGSIQGVHIPQSQEKIDNYLSSSKPKLSKLVQAYVDKYKKS